MIAHLSDTVTTNRLDIEAQLDVATAVDAYVRAQREYDNATRVFNESCRRLRDVLPADAFAKGYAFALTQWRKLLSGLDALRLERDMTIVLLAHARIERFENPETDTYDRYVPRLHKLASQIVQEWCDEVLFATYKVYTKTSDEGFNRKKTKGVGSGERVLRTTERPAHVAKNRLGLPDELPLDWNAYAAHFTTRDSRNGELANE